MDKDDIKVGVDRPIKSIDKRLSGKVDSSRTYVEWDQISKDARAAVRKVMRELAREEKLNKKKVRRSLWCGKYK